MTEEEWSYDPASIAAREAVVRSLETPDYSAEERAEMASYREELRRFNIEGVRRQMQAGE